MARQDVATDTEADGALPRVSFAKHASRAEGVSFGYHNLVTEIGRSVVNDPTSKVALHVCPVEIFDPDPRRTNALVTMWESRDVPRADVDKLRQADILIVPSTFCEKVYERYADCPIHVVPLGVDAEALPYVRREPPATGRKFVWFWTASPDPRKGWGIVAKMWEKWFGARDDCLLYVKTSALKKDDAVVRGKPMHGLRRTGNIVWDCRTLPRKEFLALYYGAHGYLYPTFGEGFGLTCAEAMATGLPVVGVSWSGQADFFHHATGYPVPYELMRMQAITERASMHEDGKYEVAVPLGGEMMLVMNQVMKDYPRALKKARRGSELIHARYTWARFRVGLREVLRRYAD